ncbi:MAG: ORF6N domain-containing protein [Bacteroidia bacterium]|nr:ORF6N domain-containing protein [Bacteroidia bacterium]
MANIELLKKRIFEIRGHRIMLDFDLADLYLVETKVLNQSVKRNIKRFPPDFMFQLTIEEWTNLKSQIVTSSWGGARKPPFAFTEQGLAMLSGVLNSDVAIDVNISIMRAFVSIRKYLSEHETNTEIEAIKERLEALESASEDNQNTFDEIYMALTQLASKHKSIVTRNPIGFKLK